MPENVLGYGIMELGKKNRNSYFEWGRGDPENGN
jgi:hypothetical protein